MERLGKGALKVQNKISIEIQTAVGHQVTTCLTAFDRCLTAVGPHLTACGSLFDRGLTPI